MNDFRILLVEDEKQMAMFIEMELIHEGFKVDVEYDGREVVKKVKDVEYNLILLDIMIPNLNGIEVCRRIREFSNVPVIMLTAKGDVSDKVIGLDAGANDYLTKPFAIEELLARLRVYTREKVLISETDTINVNDITMNDKTHQMWRAGKEIKLTKKEYDLLKILLVNKNIVLTRDQLIEAVWGYEYAGDTNVVDVFIRYLRSKIDDGFSEKAIITVRGVGYVIKGE
ncbi:response regulator transcription factor [Clostridium beijerinckii]|uniref:response regulator transcription factor n=1 Tax=Clostridium beijerinckii TaxID=1520 RepID=UPI00047C325D|nr:response regulator transcription factor [Clostridium beijerinckii]